MYRTVLHCAGTGQGGPGQGGRPGKPRHLTWAQNDPIPYACSQAGRGRPGQGGRPGHSNLTRPEPPARLCPPPPLLSRSRSTWPRRTTWPASWRRRSWKKSALGAGRCCCPGGRRLQRGRAGNLLARGPGGARGRGRRSPCPASGKPGGPLYPTPCGSARAGGAASCGGRRGWRTTRRWRWRTRVSRVGQLQPCRQC